MSINTNANNHGVKNEVILVASGSQDLANETDVLASGNLIPATGFAMNIADGQLAVVAATPDNSTKSVNDFIEGTDTVSTVPVIQIVQGTPYSSDIRNVAQINAIDHKEVVRSMPIDGRNKIAFSAKVAQHPTNDAWVIGGTAGAITPLDVTSYALNLQFKSTRNDRDFSVHGNENLTVNFTTPDYTTLATTNPLDHLIKNIVYNADLNSAGLDFNNPASKRGNRNFVAFAIDESGAVGTALEDIEVGVAFDVAVDASGGTVQYIPDASFVATIEDVIANSDLIGSSTVVVADLSTAGDVVDRADAMLIVALDHVLSYANDDIKQVKVKLGVGLETIGVDLATDPGKVNASAPFEGEGQGRKWRIEYEKRYGLNIWTAQNRPDGRYLYITPPSYIDETLDYTAYIIEHHAEYTVRGSHDGNNFFRTIILVPCTAQAETVTFTVTAASGDAQTATFSLGGTDYDVDVTNQASVALAADEIAADWLVQGHTAWTASSDGVDTVTFTKADTYPSNGDPAFAVTGGTLAGTVATTVQGGTCVTDATVQSSLDSFLTTWLQSAVVEYWKGDATQAAPFA